MNDIANAVRNARRSKRLTQDDLAARAGVSTRSIRRIEHGDAVSPDVVRSVCASLGLDAEAFPPDIRRPDEVQAHARDGDLAWALWAQVSIPVCLLAIFGAAIVLAFLSVRYDAGMVRGWAAFPFLLIVFLAGTLLPSQMLRTLFVACVGMLGGIELSLGVLNLAAASQGAMAAALATHAVGCAALAAAYIGGSSPAPSGRPGLATSSG